MSSALSPRTPVPIRASSPSSPLAPLSPIPLSRSPGPSATSFPSSILSTPLSPSLNASPAGSGRATPKGRARDLLRKHYGLGTPAPPVPLPGRPNDPMNLDSPAFDARVYYDQLITTSPLIALLKRDNELSSEIRQLESERQSLVYNHHHELIAASDTIGAMRTRADSLDADLDKLRSAFDEISRLSAECTPESALPSASGKGFVHAKELPVPPVDDDESESNTSLA
ncbi:Vps51/Vps67-domain-containing protein [Auriculariales sp. MPI-PUGE-AT-0066]|nr:Vps51/Vps67-domain-containing protein [Auriculariales sp. MPI-PUGE-AT-0066]